MEWVFDQMSVRFVADEKHLDAWEKFRQEQIEHYLVNSDAYRGLFSQGLIALLLTAWHWGLNFMLFLPMVIIALSFWGGRLLYTWQNHRNPPQGQYSSLFHKALLANTFLLTTAVVSASVQCEIRSHKMFVSGFLVYLVLSSYFVYLPSFLHIAFISLPAALTWICWHWQANFLDFTCAMWGFVYPVFEAWYFHQLEQRQFDHYHVFMKERAARERGEILERALQSMLNSVFDASCKCDSTGVVLSASKQLEELLNVDDKVFVNTNLKDLATTPEEQHRLEAFFTQCLQTSCVDVAAKIETSFRFLRKNGCKELRLVLFCVSMPCEDGSNALLIGCQRSECQDAVKFWSACEAHVSDEFASSCDETFDDQLKSTIYERACLQRYFYRGNRLEDEQSDHTLTISLSGISSLVKHSKTTSAVATQTHLETSVAAVQTATTLAKPPKLPPHREPCKATFRTRQRIIKRYKATPESTLRFLIYEALEKINPGGKGCCGLHLGLACFEHALRNFALETECKELALPAACWQCKSCYGINEQCNDDENTCFCGAELASAFSSDRYETE